MTEPVQGPGESTPFGVERDPARVLAFSDGVIAIAITLLVLETSMLGTTFESGELTAGTQLPFPRERKGGGLSHRQRP
ncbi:TMEM175 family protein [Streptomyces sp. NPDC020681]|uniref:TMEM175 family protein n=1 Tax=Streptomyces sp. NPDC020681 TaxID=3365083 RepID=UPI0037BA0717